ncbi:CNNM domain-containing protein [Thalassoglobus sp. JC818]|uniref:CNNM domain-containing protein n=1 Tax=Thalassoglobus sp. JC818 TaxID=3232136 RepID=UPI00345B0771
MSEFLNTSSIWTPGAILMGLLILGSGFFSGSETALFYLTRDEIRRLKSGGPSARLAAALLRQPDRLLTVVLFWNLIINLTYFAISFVTAKKLVASGHPTAAGALSLFALVGMILFGEIFPKSIAVNLRNSIAIAASWPLALAVRAISPILPALGTLTLAFRRAIAPSLKMEPYLNVEDIERAVDSSEVGGDLALLEQKILGRILEMSEMRTEELMRPRGTFATCHPPVDLAQLKQFGPGTEYVFLMDPGTESISRFIPLGDVSTIPEKNLEAISEEVVYVPWCGRVSATLSTLRTRILNAAVVVNEFGETIGVITEDDIVDTLLNPESSRARRLLDREPVLQVDENRFLAEGLTTLRYLGQRVGFDYEDRDDGLLTIAALLYEEFERFPEVDDECQWEGYQFRVVEANGPGKSIQVEVSKVPETTEESDEEQ